MFDYRSDLIKEKSQSGFTAQSILLDFKRSESQFEGVMICVYAPEGTCHNTILNETLNPSEYEYWKMLRSERRKRSYLLGRWAAKKAVSELCNVQDLKSMDISSGVFGQPILKCRDVYNVDVSISHTDQFICGVAYPQEHPIAVDVEMINHLNEAVIKSQMTENEHKILQAFNLKEFPEHSISTTFWTAKEALSKILKCGMMAPIDFFEIANLKKTINAKTDHFHLSGTFRHFAQYRFESWVTDDYSVSLTLPKRTILTFKNVHRIL